MAAAKISPKGKVTLRVVKQQSLTSLFGALPPTQPYPGKDAIREEVGQILGRHPQGPGAGADDPVSRITGG